MTDTLASMIQDHDGDNAATENATDLQTEASENGVEATGDVTTENSEATEAATEENTTETEEVTEEAPEIGVTMLHEWWQQNQNNVDGVTCPQVDLLGVDPDRTKFFTINDPEGGEYNGHPARKVILWEEANTFPVLDLPGSEMDVYTNGLKIVYPYGEGTAIRVYGVRTGLNIIYTMQVGEYVLPYAIEKMKKKDAGINMVAPPAIADVEAKLASDVDAEGIQLHYKQITKSISDLPTVQHCVDWLLTRQADVRDVNHLLQIDKVVNWLITG